MICTAIHPRLANNSGRADTGTGVAAQRNESCRFNTLPRSRVGKPVQFWFLEDRRLLRELTVDLVRRPQSRAIFQPTTQPTMLDVLYDFRELWQSPRCCKLLKHQIVVDLHGGSQRFESSIAHHIFFKSTAIRSRNPIPQHPDVSFLARPLLGILADKTWRLFAAGTTGLDHNTFVDGGDLALDPTLSD